MKENCIFCKIVKGELPCKKIYEDEKTLAFLDINPVTEGHLLIIPKEHYENIYDIPEEELSFIIKNAKLISNKLKERLGNSGINLFQANGKDAGQEVFHFHLHLVPRYKDKEGGIGIKRGEKPPEINETHKKLSN